jgi:hypothetical protein
MTDITSKLQGQKTRPRQPAELSPPVVRILIRKAYQKAEEHRQIIDYVEGINGVIVGIKQFKKSVVDFLNRENIPGYSYVIDKDYHAREIELPDIMHDVWRLDKESFVPDYLERAMTILTDSLKLHPYCIGTFNDSNGKYIGAYATINLELESKSFDGWQKDHRDHPVLVITQYFANANSPRSGIEAAIIEGVEFCFVESVRGPKSNSEQFNRISGISRNFSDLQKYYTN